VIAYTFALAASYAFVVCAVTVEVSWLASQGLARRVARSLRTALPMLAGAMVVGAVYTRVLRLTWNSLSPHSATWLVSFWHDHAVIGALAAFVAWDAAGWMYHWIGHRTRIGWAAHQPHHSGEDFDITLGLRQSWAPFHGIVIQPLIALAGFDFRTIIVCAAVSNCWQVVEHSSVPTRLPRVLGELVMTPAAHRHHHALGAAAVNLGPVLTCWDRLAGTWLSPDAPPPARYGLGYSPSRNAVTVELAGWRNLLGANDPRSARTAPVPCLSTWRGETATQRTTLSAGTCERSPRTNFSPRKTKSVSPR
jgi:sterol desaturase/sphingolipid hydroxylase (fatty acid hydroxylase superfamily)